LARRAIPGGIGDALGNDDLPVVHVPMLPRVSGPWRAISGSGCDTVRHYSGPVRPALRRASAATLALAALTALTMGPAHAAGEHRDVDPLVGTGGPPPWRSGGTTPAATMPFGMVQLGPDTTDSPGGEPSANPAGYAAGDPLLRGFSPTHLSGAGCRTFGDVPILPVRSAVPPDPGSATAELDRSTERAQPGRYSVSFTDGVRVDLAAAARAGLMRFRFPVGERAFAIIKAGGSLAGTQGQRVRFPSDHEVAVRVRSGGFCGMPNRYVLHVLYRFDRPFRSHGTRAGDAWLGFGPAHVVRAAVAVSYVDARGARRNLDRADVGWSVGRLAARAGRAWDAELGRVAPTGGTADDRRLLRTALYHALLHPTPVSDVDGRYRGFDGRVHDLPRGETQLSQVSGWDVYRTEVPLLAWLRPDMASAMVRSLLRDARQGGWLPRWPLASADTGVMNGDPAGPITAAAWAFGARDLPLDEVVDRLVRQGDRTDGPRDGLADYLRLGWVPTADGRFGSSTTLEYATADFAISRLARAAGRPAVADRFRARSGAWRHLLDPDRSLLEPRDADGAFRPELSGFQEGNALQYTFGGVPQDMAGLLSSLGSAEQTEDRLDAFFAQLNAGGEPYAWLGNEPSFLSPWAYQWLGDPARTQDVVDRARAELWSLTPAGLPGNDDLGALSAWYVWTALGLYPLTPGTPNLALGMPAFDRIVVRPLGRPATRIVRTGAGPHVAGVRVDGRDHPRSWLGRLPRHVDVLATDEAQPAWGTAVGDRPPSYPGS
jgi:predicted alpha-1,2-mannosidase